MDLTLSEEERQIRKAARELAEDNFAENAGQWGPEKPVENLEVLAEHGYTGMTLPSEYGGGDASFFELVLAMEGIGEVCPDTARALQGTNNGNAHAVAIYGSERIKEEYLLPVCEGKATIATAMSEPNVGSSVRDMETEAVEDGDELVINGEKIYPHPKKDAYNTFVRMPDENIGQVLIDPSNPGFKIQEPDYNLAGDPHSQIFIEDCRVSKDRILASGPDSFKKSITTYNANRVTGVARGWVYAKWLFEEALEYSQYRNQGGQPIAEYQAVSHKLAEMATKLEATRWLIYRSLSGDELPGRALSCMTRLFGTQRNHEVVDEALQIKGAAGFIGDTTESYAYARLRGDQIAGGTKEIHRNNVSKDLLENGYPDLE